jgi:chromosome segregation ATPase
MSLETLIWVGGLIIEALVVTAAVLAVLLRRSRQQLLTQVAGQQPPAHEIAAVEKATEVPEPTPGEPATNESKQPSEIVDNAALDESSERLQQRLDATNQSLQRLEVDLQQDPAGAGANHPELEVMKDNLQAMSSDVGSLQESSAKLQHQAKELRRDVTALRDKLKDSETDVQKLQAEKEALGAEFAALNREYERIYAGSANKGA